MNRHHGVLLHITSLPGGLIGSFGAEARAFVDTLAAAGYDRWQVLPLTPPDGGGSPYSSVGAFALSRLCIDIPTLVEDGLLDRLPTLPKLPPGAVDYAAARKHLDDALDLVHRGLKTGSLDELKAEMAARIESEHWLLPYARFVARVRSAGHDDWARWPKGMRASSGAAAKSWDSVHKPAVDRVVLEQTLALRQWEALRAYANERGVKIIGDVPIFVAGGSADVWANPEQFDLDDTHRPVHVAGVPPDYFSETGQLWGNPLYDWDTMQADGFSWWLARFENAFERFDEVRVDHFRGFDAFWQIPRDHKTAMNGEWVQAPGAALFDAAVDTLGERIGAALAAEGDPRPLPIIVEDLGTITPGVEALRDRYKFPGTRVLQFGLGDDPGNPHRHVNIPENAVAYTGTHDNETTRGWYVALDEHSQWLARETFFAQGEHDIAASVRGIANRSPARWVVSPVQDLLNLGNDARMNTPGTVTGNWTWRMTEIPELPKAGE